MNVLRKIEKSERKKLSRTNSITVTGVASSLVIRKKCEVKTGRKWLLLSLPNSMNITRKLWQRSSSVACGIWYLVLEVMFEIFRLLRFWITDQAFNKTFQESRKRRATDAAWGMQLSRHSTETYLVCYMDCDEGYEPFDSSLNKIGCRMSDATWMKPFAKSTHKW